MAMTWFRLYRDLINSPKYQRLSDPLKVWLFELWMIAAGEDGLLPKTEDIAFLARAPLAEAEQALLELRSAGWFEETARGIQPRNWDKHQCVSDTSTGRVKRHRAKKNGNVSETVDETVTETFRETDVKRFVERTEREEKRRVEKRKEEKGPPYPPS